MIYFRTIFSNNAQIKRTIFSNIDYCKNVLYIVR